MASADRLIEVFNEAKARPVGAERDQFLSEACRDEPELKEQVLSLLLAHEGAGDFLKYTQAIPPVTLLTEKPGDKIGRYKLLQKIGEGGCGVVYMAEQEEPVRRRVAFKVIKLGMDTKQVVARFEAEGQALAMMDHPNIAKVFDAGATNTGRPYFVMELVRGIKITEYCDQNNLPTEARLKLFTQVCHAIQHAHQKGIIHRDIKPSNILVTINDGLPVPKVIDFGIAKAIEQRLTDKTVFTAFEQFIGTPAYMSPEQAEMTSLDIDTRADIYSLGVLLYELLSGNTPFDAEKLVAAGVAEIRRIIREQEPPKPSTRLNTLCDADQGTVASRRHTDPPKLIHLLRGDLDWIVMKCLEKDRTRRYETANGLALDLQRHLDNEPIIARPPSTVYRFQKLVRRNKLAFAASATVLLVLLGGIAVSTWQAIRATRAEREQTRLREQAENARNNEARERAKAEANEKKAASEAAKSQQVSTFLKDTLKGVGPSVALGRDTRMLREILNQTARNLSGLKGQPAVEADLRETLGVVYRDLGDYTDAEAMLVQALELRKELHPNNDPEVARSLHELAEVFRLQTRNSEAEKYFRQALTMRRKLFDNDNVDVAATMFGLAEVIRRDSATRAEEAVQLHLEALAMRRKVLGNQHLDVARSLTGLAILIKKAPENLPQAEACLNEALSIQRGQLGDEHPDVAYTLSNLGILLKSVSGKRAEAERMLREAVAMQKKLLGDHRETALSIYFLAQTVQNPTEAEQLYREALTMRRKVLGVKHADTASSLRSLINHLNSAGKLAEIESLYREVLAEQRSGPGNGSSAMVETLSNLAENLQLQSKPVEAEKASREALDILSKLPGSEFAKFPTAVRRLAAALNAQGKPGEAEKLYEESITAVPQKPGKSNPALGQMLHNYANFLLYQRNNPAAAVEQYLKALAIRREKTDGALVVTLRELGHALLTSANAKDAEPYLRESQALYRKLYSKDDIWGTANANLLLAQALQQLHRLPEAEQSYNEALAAYANSEGIGGDGYNTTVRSLVQFLNSEDQPAKVEALCRKILAQQRAALTNDNPAVALTLIILADGLEAQGKVTEAEATIRESLAMASHARADATNAGLFNSLAWRLVTAENPTSSDATVAVELAQKAVVATNRKNVGILDTLAVAHSLAGQFTNAVAVQHEAIALLQDKKQIENYTVRLKLYESNSPYRNQAALARRVSALLAQGKFAEAESPARECLAQREKQSPDDWLTFNAMSMLGGSLLGQKKFPAAEPLLLSGYEGMKQRADIIPANGKVRLQECIQRLVQLYKATDQSEKAAEWNRKLAEFSQP